jgi:hypothetical protein
MGKHSVGVVDNLSVLVTANSKQFTATMNGVAQTATKTQGALARISAAGVKGAAALAAGFAASGAAAIAFAGAVKRMGTALGSYGTDVPATTIAAFEAMDLAMDRAAKTMAITVAGGMADASSGFLILVERVKDTVTNSKALSLLFKGMGYIFAIVGEAIKSVSNVVGVMVNGFMTLIKGVRLASLELDSFMYGVDNSEEIYKLTSEIHALGEESKNLLTDAVDFNRFALAVEKVYKDQAELERKKQEDAKNGAASELALEALVLAAYRKRQDEIKKTITANRVSHGVAVSILENYDKLLREVDREQSKLRADSANLAVETAVWRATREEQVALMKQRAIKGILDQEAQDQAQAQALWESGWKGKAQTLTSVMSGFSTLMETNSKRMFKVGKAAAIADAIISSLLAANRAYSALAGIPYVGPALGAAAAAAALAAGYANVSKIKAQQFGGGSASGGANFSGADGSAGGGASTGAGPAAGAPGGTTNVNVTLIGDRFGAGQVRGLIGQINEQLGDNAKLRVRTGGV